MKKSTTGEITRDKTLCKYSNCVMLGTSGLAYGQDFWCAWHWQSKGALWVDSNTEFVKWRELQREQYPFNYGYILLYVHDETIWQAIKGGITHLELTEAIEAKRAELKKLEMEEIKEFCERNGLRGIRDMRAFCRGKFTQIKKDSNRPTETVINPEKQYEVEKELAEHYNYVGRPEPKW